MNEAAPPLEPFKPGPLARGLATAAAGPRSEPVASVSEVSGRGDHPRRCVRDAQEHLRAAMNHIGHACSLLSGLFPVMLPDEVQEVRDLIIGTRYQLKRLDGGGK